MMKPFATAFIAFLAVSPSAQRAQPDTRSNELVELDVTAVDRDNRPVTDLRRDEFTIKEDGRSAEIKTFSTVTALGSAQPDDGRWSCC